jgi:hypothetical protein
MQGRNIPDRIPINRDTLELGGKLGGHKLERRCSFDCAPGQKYGTAEYGLSESLAEYGTSIRALLEKYGDEGAEIWWYASTMPLCGTSGYAVVLGEYVLQYFPVCMH